MADFIVSKAFIYRGAEGRGQCFHLCVCVCDRSDGWCRDGDGRGGTVALHVAPPPAPCSLRRRPASQETTVSDATQSQHFLHSLQIKGVLVFSVDPLLLKGLLI